MKVLYVINGLGTGGAERSLSEMLPLLRDRGVDARVAVLFARERGVEEQVRDSGVPVALLGASSLAGRARELRRMLRASPPDLVHTTIFEADLAGRLAAAGTRIPVLTSLVNTSYEPARLADPALRRWRVRVAQAAETASGRLLTAHFHAISEAVKRSAIAHLRISADRITVVPRGRDSLRLGVPSATRRAAARSALGVPADSWVVVAAGRQEFQKGHGVLVDAFASLAADHPEARLLLAGREGAATPDIRRCIERGGLGRRIRVLGHRDDLPEVLAAADVFAFPSVYEGLGGVLLEAMALGLPIVASDLPAVREVVEPPANAILCPAGDAAALARSLAWLVDDPPLTCAFGRRSRQIFEERFTLDRSVAGMLAIYERVGRSHSP